MSSGSFCGTLTYGLALLSHLSRVPWGLFYLNMGQPSTLFTLLPPHPLRRAMAGMKTATGDYIDSSWELRVFVGEENPEAESVTLRVTGESHIGGVLLKIVEEISECLLVPPLTSAPRGGYNYSPLALPGYPCCMSLDNWCHSDSGTSLIIWFQKRHFPNFPSLPLPSLSSSHSNWFC